MPQCRRFEVPAPPAANSSRNFKSKSGTGIINLLVPLCFRSSCQVVRTSKAGHQSLAEQALSSVVQPLDQAVSAARRDDRRKLITSRREVTDGPVEIDIDHPSAAHQIV